jgi:hypothetical protein
VKLAAGAVLNLNGHYYERYAAHFYHLQGRIGQQRERIKVGTHRDDYLAKAARGVSQLHLQPG